MLNGIQDDCNIGREAGIRCRCEVSGRLSKGDRLGLQILETTIVTRNLAAHSVLLITLILILRVFKLCSCAPKPLINTSLTTNYANFRAGRHPMYLCPGISVKAKFLRVMPQGGGFSSAIRKQGKELHIDWAKVYVASAKIAQSAELADNWLTSLVSKLKVRIA